MTLFATVLVFGCGGGSSSSGDSAEDASIQLVNLLVDSPAISAVYNEVGADSENESRLEALEFPSASASVSLSLGEYDLDVVYDTLNEEEVAILPQRSLSVGAEREIVVATFGTVDEPELRIFDYELEDFSDLDEDEQADVETLFVEFFHGAPSQGDIDVYLTETDESILTRSPLFRLSYGSSSGLQLIQRDSNYRIWVTLADTNDVVFDSNTISINTLRRQFFFLTDAFGPAGVSMQLSRAGSVGSFIVNDQEDVTTFLATNWVSNVPGIDVYFGDTADTPILGDVLFGEDSEIQELLDPETKSVNVTPSGDTQTFLFEENYEFGPGEQVRLVVSGNEPDDSIAGQFILEDSRPIAIFADLTIVNAAPSAEQVNLFILAPGQEPLGATPTHTMQYGSNANSRLDLGDYDLYVLSQDGSTIIGPVRLTFFEGNYYTLYLVDNPAGGPPTELRYGDSFAR